MYKFIKIFVSFMIFLDTIVGHNRPLGRFNAAFNKKTYQITNTNNSWKAVDGNHNTNYKNMSCTHTRKQNTWWAVDLRMVYYVYSVTLTNRLTYHKRLHNFTISGSNTSHIPGSDDSVLCAFQLEPMGRGETKKFPCLKNFSTRFVVINKTTLIHKYRPLTLCEVEVEAKCQDGSYGENCSEICSGNCALESLCNVIDGTCSEGCKSGFTSNKCDQVCPDGKYGDHCYGKCSNKCQNSTCDKFDDTGVCLSGCIAGYYGDHCNTTCPMGTYGKGCKHNCSENCSDGCDQINGSCYGGKSEFTSDKCGQVCPDGNYGDRCSGNCSDKCQNSTYDKFDDIGLCLSGCIAGYADDHCNTTCPMGTYGNECKLKYNCSENYSEGCDPHNGSCNCSDGFTRDHCLRCPIGYYEWGYESQCKRGCDVVCDHMTGACKCQDGYTWLKCDTVNSEANGNMITWTVVCACIALAIISVVIGLVVCKVMRNRHKCTVTKTNDDPVTTKRKSDVTDSGTWENTVFELIVFPLTPPHMLPSLCQPPPPPPPPPRKLPPLPPPHMQPSPCQPPLPPPRQ